MGGRVTDAVVDVDEAAPVRSLLASAGLFVTVILGVSLWAQLAAFTARTEIGADPGLLRVLAFVIPFAVLGAGVWFRSAIGLLALFPMSLLGPLFLTPDGAAASFADPWSAGRVCASMALYLAVVSAWIGTIRSSRAVERRGMQSAGDDEQRRYVYTRLVPLLLWWAVPTYAVFWDPAIVGTLSQSYGEDARIAQVFLSTLVFFAWCVVGYMSFIVPALNLEYDARRIERSASRLGEAVDKRLLLRRLALTVAGTLLVILLLLMVV